MRIFYAAPGITPRYIIAIHKNVYRLTLQRPLLEGGSGMADCTGRQEGRKAGRQRDLLQTGTYVNNYFD
jgi:hypothetical protein